MVPVSNLVALSLCALLGLGVPFLLAWRMVKMYRQDPLTILLGAGVFVVFALGLEPILHQIVLKGPYGSAILGNTWLYALYGGLAAGVFEETGRFLGMKFLMKKEPAAAEPGVAYGIGHGGAEMLLLFGVAMVGNIVLAAMINSGHADLLLATVPAEAQEQAHAQFAQLQDAGFGTYLFGLWERCSALILQVSLSLMVWTAVRKGGKWLWLFPAAIILHCLVDGCAVLLSKSAGMLLTETLLFCMALAVGATGWMLARRL